MFAAFSISKNGVLAYQRDVVTPSPLIWVDRDGKQIGTAGEPGYYSSPRISPDEKRILVMKHPVHTENDDVWIYDISRNSMTKFTSKPNVQIDAAAWSRDGMNIYFPVNGALYSKSSDGAQPEKAILPTGSNSPQDVSPDGKFLMINSEHPNTLTDLEILPLSGNQKTLPYLETSNDERYARFSPDGKWVTYVSYESGSPEVYIRPFPAANSGKWQVSVAGGTLPRWKGDGKEIYFISNENKMMAATVNAGTTLELGAPRALFEMPQGTMADDVLYDVTSDGQRFLLNAPPGTQYFSTITIALNWKPKH